MEDALRDYFDRTDWDVLLSPHGEDIEEVTHCLTDYLNCCVEVVSPTKTVQRYPNNKAMERRKSKLSSTGRKPPSGKSTGQGGNDNSTTGCETFCEGS